jgi:protein-S-isoprenylcysteine O-methyltransferase Ste14
MHALTVILFVVGVLLAAAGTLGFYVVAHTAPDPDDLSFNRTMASIGRRLIYAGIATIVLAHPLLVALAVVGFAAAASHLTKAPLRARTGAAS